MNNVEIEQERFIRMPEVMYISGLKRGQIYRMVATKEFPPMIHLSERCVGWTLSSVRRWRDKRIADAKIAAESEDQTVCEE